MMFINILYVIVTNANIFSNPNAGFT